MIRFSIVVTCYETNVLTTQYFLLALCRNTKTATPIQASYELLNTILRSLGEYLSVKTFKKKYHKLIKKFKNNLCNYALKISFQ